MFLRTSKDDNFKLRYMHISTGKKTTVHRILDTIIIFHVVYNTILLFI